MFNLRDLNSADWLVRWLQGLGDGIAPVCSCCRVCRWRQGPQQSSSTEQNICHGLQWCRDFLCSLCHVIQLCPQCLLHPSGRARWLLGGCLEIFQWTIWQWHIFIKVFSIRFRNSERVVLPGMRRRATSIAVFLPCRSKCCVCPRRSAALAQPAPAPRPVDEGESRSVLMQQDVLMQWDAFSCKS